MCVVLQAWGVHWEAAAAKPHRSLHAPSAALADPGSEASVAAHGIAAILLATGMCAVAPAGAAAAALRRRRGRHGPGRRSRGLILTVVPHHLPCWQATL